MSAESRCTEAEATPHDVAQWIRDQTKGYRTVVDLGAGRFEKLLLTEATRKIGLEICPEYVEVFGTNPHVEPIHKDMLNYRSVINDRVLPFPLLAMLIDSLEHLRKSDALNLISDLRRDFDKIIVLCPDGHCPQDKDAWGYGNDYYQTHRSEWSVREFKKLGFDAGLSPTNESQILATWRR